MNTTRRVLSTTEIEKEMSGAYIFFFTISQLGGLYAFLIVLLGFLLRPVYDKTFNHESVNTLNMSSKLIFTQLKNELINEIQLSEAENQNEVMHKTKSVPKPMKNSDKSPTGTMLFHQSTEKK